MKAKNNLYVKEVMSLIYLFALLILTPSCGGKQCNLQVLAFYYPWYGTPEISGKWIRWNNAGHNPDVRDENGLRDIAAARHPYPDVYDSSDPNILRKHLKEAEETGIDGFVYSWWGISDLTDKNLKVMFDVLEEQHSGIKIAIYYEVVPENNIQRTIEDISYLKEHYMYRANYLKEKGQPVLFIYGRALFKGLWCISAERCSPGEYQFIDWRPVLSRHPDIFYIADVMTYALTIPFLQYFKNMGFNGIHVYNPVIDIIGGMDIEERYTAFIGMAEQYGFVPYVTVIPGYDDTHLQRAYPIYLDREDGELYVNLWKRAKEAGARRILITSFNEWHEGTEIEPSHEFGAYYLQLTRQMIENMCE